MGSPPTASPGRSSGTRCSPMRSPGAATRAAYSYVLVHTQLPQRLELWSAGHVVLTSPGNTGIASRPTKPGTFPVFEHIPVGTMSGTNPDGSHYHDPGIRWISYFNGGDALHEFPRASFGTPQSLGCVELPAARPRRSVSVHADRHARHDRERLTRRDGGRDAGQLPAAADRGHEHARRHAPRRSRVFGGSPQELDDGLPPRPPPQPAARMVGDPARLGLDADRPLAQPPAPCGAAAARRRRAAIAPRET